MKRIEFQTYVNDDNTVSIPMEVAARIERDCPVWVVMLVGDRAGDRQWAGFTAEQFSKGYHDTDAIYDYISFW